MFDKKIGVVQKGMEKYLENRYGSEFVVEKPILTGNAGFGYNVYQAYAYPKDKPELRFVTSWDNGDPGRYDDGYLRVKWTAEGKVEVAKVLKEVYGEDVPFIYDYYLSTYRQDLLSPEEFKMTYRDTLEKYVEDSSTRIEYVLFRDGEIDKTVEAEKAFEVYKRLIYDNSILQGYRIYIVYIPKEYKEEFMPRFNEAKNKQIYDYTPEKLFEEVHLINSLSIFGVSKNQKDPIIINSAEELIDMYDY